MRTSSKRFIAPHFGITFIILLLFIVLCSLSFWQFQRGQMKQNILEDFSTNSQLKVLTTGDLPQIAKSPKVYEHRKMTLTGSFMNKQNILLDNKVLHGRIGYEVLTPFLTNNNHYILVNRGWLPLGKSRKELPAIEPGVGIIKIKGQLEHPTNNRFIKNNVTDTPNHFPMLVQQIEINQLATILNIPFLESVLNLDEGQLTSFEVPPAKATWLSPQKHYAYALQWLLLAISLLTIYTVANRCPIANKSN